VAVLDVEVDEGAPDAPVAGDPADEPSQDVAKNGCLLA
jgi:hypothetical protein